MIRAIFFVLLLAACGSGPDSGGSAGNSPSPEATHVPNQSIDATLERHAERLMAHEGIQGIALSETEAGEPCLLILATVPAEELSGVVPDSLDGWPVRIQSGDEIRPMD